MSDATFTPPQVSVRFQRGDQVRSRITGRYGVVAGPVLSHVDEPTSVIRVWVESESESAVTECMANECCWELLARRQDPWVEVEWPALTDGELYPWVDAYEWSPGEPTQP